MSIKSYVDELEQLHMEIKRNNARNKILRQRVKELEANIADYLAQKNQPGLKYKGRAIVVENKAGHTTKGKKEKESDIISFLEDLGVEDPKEAYIKLQDVQRGDLVEKQKIKFKKLPKQN
jgi:cell division septum initiation protein DivIVA